MELLQLWLLILFVSSLVRGASIFSFKIMGKALLVSLVLAVIMGLAGSSIANLSLACCHQDYDCCSKSCTCQSQHCQSQWQPVADLSKPLILFDILPRASQKHGYVFFQPDEPIRSIFHPPRQLSWTGYLSNRLKKRSRTMKKAIFTLFLTVAILSSALPAFSGEKCCLRRKCDCIEQECCKENQCACEGSCCQSGECKCTKDCSCTKK